jgi:DNA-binding NarL/FixJ family response regulator
MFEGKRILILDDDEMILKSFKKYFKKIAPNNDIVFYDKYDESIYDDIHTFDAGVFDYYFDRNISTPDIIKNLRNVHPNMFILCCSCMFIISNDKHTHINKEIMKDCLNAGANRVIPKSPSEIVDTLKIHFILRESGKHEIVC